MRHWISDRKHARHDFVFKEWAEGLIEGRLAGFLGYFKIMIIRSRGRYLEEFTVDSVYDWNCFWIGNVYRIRSSAYNRAVCLVKLPIIDWSIAFE
jgi:hypothetical protein